MKLAKKTGLLAQGKQEKNHSRKEEKSSIQELEKSTPAFQPKASQSDSYADYSSGLTRPDIKKRRIALFKKWRNKE